VEKQTQRETVLACNSSKTRQAVVRDQTNKYPSTTTESMLIYLVMAAVTMLQPKRHRDKDGAAHSLRLNKAKRYSQMTEFVLRSSNFGLLVRSRTRDCIPRSRTIHGLNTSSSHVGFCDSVQLRLLKWQILLESRAASTVSVPQRA